MKQSYPEKLRLDYADFCNAQVGFGGAFAVTKRWAYANRFQSAYIEKIGRDRGKNRHPLSRQRAKAEVQNGRTVNAGANSKLITGNI